MGRKRIHPTTIKFCKKCGRDTEREGATKDRKHGGCMPCAAARRAANRDAINARAKARRDANKPPTLMEQGLLPKRPSTKLPKGHSAVYLAEFRHRETRELFFKVGISQDPATRVQQLGGSTYHTRCLSMRVFPDKREAITFERAYHESHKQKYSPSSQFSGAHQECYLQPTDIFSFNI